ncbi:MAG TPA: glucosamine-6-phosphate deaminase, partial [Candidatus Sumerlaeota bacterium]|nr:glucosamine-6-phosphate deaminase [Candidatus Sumerlaeota bacterium]
DNIVARAEEVYHFLDGIAASDETRRRRAQARRMLFNLMNVYEDEEFENIAQRVAENLHYLETLYPGKKDVPIIQKLKGMQREYEEELIWGYVGTSPNDVFHTRLGFYTGDIFTEQPTMARDVAQILPLIEKLKPTIVSLAFDPEGAGPDTHYKVLQVLSDALLQYNKKTGKSPYVWGYRNVWFKFHPAESNIFVPVSLNTLAVMNDSFMHCFGSQKNASFPSYEYDGPFCYQAQKLWVKQFEMIKTCLGERFFTDNPSPRLRACRAMVFIKGMELSEFAGKARTLAQATEAVKGS